MRLLTLLALLAFVPTALAQADSFADLVPGTELSQQQLADLGIDADGPGLVVELAAPTLGYDLPAELRASRKSPEIATLIGILIPGGGQIYAGEINRGLTILAVGYGSLLGGSLSGNSTLALVGLGVYIGATVYGVLDADDAAERYNRAHGLALAPAVIETPHGPVAGLGLNVGL